jgi:uncharacterized protein (TIGR01777 family)
VKIAIAGGSGFIGAELTRQLLQHGHEVSVLTRNPASVRAGRAVEWNAKSQGEWSPVVAGADVVVNLAGENIGAGRWTEARKQRLIGSRLNATRALIETMRGEPARQRAFISASAVGYYGLRGDEELDETSPRGSGFLAELSQQWEREAREAEPLSRLIILRLGVVMEEGGALAKMMLPFKLGVGGRVGSGEQWMSWVDREDVIRLVEWVIAKSDARGVYNGTSPNPVRNREFARALGRALHRPAMFPAPSFMLRLLFGQMADEVLLGGQRVVPVRAVREGFTFRQPSIDATLERVTR